MNFIRQDNGKTKYAILFDAVLFYFFIYFILFGSILVKITKKNEILIFLCFELDDRWMDLNFLRLFFFCFDNTVSNALMVFDVKMVINVNFASLFRVFYQENCTTIPFSFNQDQLIDFYFDILTCLFNSLYRSQILGRSIVCFLKEDLKNEYNYGFNIESWLAYES